MVAWKEHERAIAHRLGGVRTGPSGREGPDISHPRYAIECKESRDPLPQWLRGAINQVVSCAPKDKLPMVIFHVVGDKHDEDLVVIRLVDFERFID